MFYSNVRKLTCSCNTCGRLGIRSLHQHTFQDHRVYLHRQRMSQGFEREVQGLKGQEYFLLQEILHFPELLPVVVLLLVVAVDNFAVDRSRVKKEGKQK